MIKKLLTFCLAIVYCTVSFSEPESDLSVTILPTSDTSELGLAEPLQYALSKVLESTGALKVQISGYSLPGFTAPEIKKAFDVLQSDLISFTYIEKSRISVFLFAKDRPKEFIVSYEMLDNPPNGDLTSEFIEAKFRKSVSTALNNYNNSDFQLLPGVENTVGSLSEGEQQQRAEEAKTLFRELAALENKQWYAGANIGMVRYSQPQLEDSVANSTVNFGGYLGTHLNGDVSVEAGFDVFNYLLFHSDLRYRLPLLERYANFSVTGGIGRFLASVTQGKDESSNIPLTGSMIFGPGLGFDVPLLGAQLRGEIRYYLGSTGVFVGTYGVIIAL